MSQNSQLSENKNTQLKTRGKHNTANRLFQASAQGSGILILLTLAAVALFLIVQALPAFQASEEELSASSSWFPADTSIIEFVGPLVFGTVLVSIIALAIAVPFAIGIGLFISHYAPRRLAQPLGYIIDLLAAIPSVVYGLWGVLWLLPKLYPVWDTLHSFLGWIPLFSAPPSNPPKVILTVGVVLAIMILPIVTAVCREVFLQTPKLHEEASLALGATRWEMIRQAVLPFARSGIISGAMLGLGRALGETMAVLMIISPMATGAADGLRYSWDLLVAGQHQTIAAHIAAQFPEAHGLSVSVLVSAGLALFVITLVVNMLARWIVSRRKDFSGAN